jgi:Zn-finger nucleic acid-binding protein
VQCFTLQPPGAFTCARCGKELELEPVLDPTDAPCPRCRTPLEALAGDDARVHECPRCGGMFVPRVALAELLSRAESRKSAFAVTRVPSLTPLHQVTYVPCPLCHHSMNRVNFGKGSGVVVDVCRDHGTWFDGGELTQVVAFASSGGLAEARALAEAEKRAAMHVELGGVPVLDDGVAAWRDFLQSLFR